MIYFGRNIHWTVFVNIYSCIVFPVIFNMPISNVLWAQPFSFDFGSSYIVAHHLQRIRMSVFSNVFGKQESRYFSRQFRRHIVQTVVVLGSSQETVISLSITVLVFDISRFFSVLRIGEARWKFATWGRSSIQDNLRAQLCAFPRFLHRILWSCDAHG